MSESSSWLKKPTGGESFDELATMEGRARRAEERSRTDAFTRQDQLVREARDTVRWRRWSRQSLWRRLWTRPENFPVSEREVRAVVLEWQQFDAVWKGHVDDEQTFGRLTSMYAASARLAAERERRGSLHRR